MSADPKQDAEVAALRTVSSTDLFALDLTPPPMVVPGLIATGLNIFGGAPKSGKSFAAMQLAHAVATGGYWLGGRAVQGRAVYLALEDTLHRLKHRMRGLRLEPTPALEFATESAMLKKGGLEAIHKYIHEHDDVKLVVIDTLARVKDLAVGGGNAYETDSQLGGALQQVAFNGEVAFLILTHMSKAGHKDFLLSLSGSAGLPGAADVVMGLQRVRNDTRAKLHLTGRDLDERTLHLDWTPQGWTLLEAYRDKGGYN